MALLLNSNIDTLVQEHIRGEVARIGGSVNQLVDYANAKVTDINIIDGGFGYVKRIRDIRSVRSLFGTIERYGKQEFNYLRRGERVSRDRKTICLDMHEALNHPELRHKFDASISSNVLEHSPDPLRLLLNFYFITKKDGWQHHAIPHYRYTYDLYREPTPVSHMIRDFETGQPFSDTTHTEDYIQSAIVKHGWQKKFHTEYPVAYPFMHFHVFDEHNTRELFNFVFEQCDNDIVKTEEYSDNVVLFRNRLNRNFEEKYGELIERHAAGEP